jgi:hypothetical protein
MKSQTLSVAVVAFTMSATALPSAFQHESLVVRHSSLVARIAQGFGFGGLKGFPLSTGPGDEKDDGNSSTSTAPSATVVASEVNKAVSSKKSSATTTGTSSKTTKTSTTKKSSSTTTAASSKATKTSATKKSSTTTAATTSATGSGNAVVAASGMPASSGTSALSAVQTIAAGESFDCGYVAYDLGVSCDGQEEGQDPVFYLEEGASLSNCIIGPNQSDGVHCYGSCTLTNVWWPAVCEDAFTIKEQDSSATTYIKGGGAFGADDKVLQHNGAGTLSVSDFTVETFGKLYRSCGNCDSMYERHVIMDSISASDGSELAGINSNYGDSATFTNIVASDVDDICVTYTGTDDNDEEPTENGSGADGTYCIYSDSDITTS